MPDYGYPSLDAEALIASRRVEGNVIAVLARLGDERQAVRRILARIAKCSARRREEAFQELTVLSGLRNLEAVVKGEAKQMPILNDIIDHGIIGRERKRGIAIGMEKGLEKGLQKGRIEGEQLILIRLICQRFGPVSAPVRKRIQAMSPAGLEKLAMRIIDAASLEEVLR